MTSALDHESMPLDGWTTDDLDSAPDDGRRRELIDGVLWRSPAPTSDHQQIVWRLAAALDRRCPAAHVVNQGVEVRISNRRSLVPDVLVTTVEAARQSPPRFTPHDVVLVVEVESPSSYTMDRITKPALYANAGIPHYWRVRLDEGLQVSVYRLDPLAEVYREVGAFDETVTVAEPWPVELPLTEVRPRA